jgi:hypothetical protein
LSPAFRARVIIACRQKNESEEAMLTKQASGKPAHETAEARESEGQLLATNMVEVLAKSWGRAEARPRRGLRRRGGDTTSGEAPLAFTHCRSELRQSGFLDPT